MTVRNFTAISLAGTMLLSSAALAQDADLQPEADVIPDNVQTAFVYGDDAAPPCPEDAICVVARLPDGDRYRIPSNLRFSDNPANDSWTQRVEKLELVGNFGALSCSPVGAGGFTGCTQQLVDAAFADKRNGEQVRFSQLIQAAREERLSTIDEDAAAEQSRVEQIEREYLERLERERAAPTPGEETASELPRLDVEAASSDGPNS
ncbi:hypothetical protein ACRAQ7_05400 [Erythrobacter sp. W53]|uniref:hypothetical protein n=1 Tax=Erythrobacter sp. W53 TaxID=3425947 RepID=UPI003D766B12